MSRAEFWLSLADAKTIDWDDVAERLPYAGAMKACQQDPVFHAEGDVWTHTRMVVDALVAARSQCGIVDTEWPAVFLAALLHDIAKSETRAEMFDKAMGRVRVTHNHHARRGAIKAWGFLWREGVPTHVREQVFHLINWHQRVFFAMFASSLDTDIIRFSVVGRWRSLLALAMADTRGRIGPCTDQTLSMLGRLNGEVVRRDCLDIPWRFSSDHARVRYCRERGRRPDAARLPPSGSQVVVLSGLPCVAKDTYCQTVFAGLPVITIDPWVGGHAASTAEKNAIDRTAFDEARTHLRAKRSFVWNAIDVSRLTRDTIIELCLEFDAHVEVHALDPAPRLVFGPMSAPDVAVPAHVLDRLIETWEPPAPDEAHRITWLSLD